MLARDLALQEEVDRLARPEQEYGDLVAVAGLDVGVDAVAHDGHDALGRDLHPHRTTEPVDGPLATDLGTSGLEDLDDARVFELEVHT